MKTKRSQEGYLLIDHTASPGDVIVPEGTKLESATLLCGHCQRILLRNPLRTRSRFHCSGCNEYVCDFCGDPIVTGCKNFVQLLDKMQEEAFKALNIKEI